MPGESSEQPKKRLSLRDAMEAGVFIFAMPVLLGFVAQAFLPLQQIAMHAPNSLKAFVVDGKSVGTLIFALVEIIAWPFAIVRGQRKLNGFHPKGTYQAGKINIWVAELEGDSAKHEARRRMVASLQQLFGDSVAILLADIAPMLVDTGLAGEEANAGNLVAQEFLKANEGEVILWGQYFPAPAPLIELRLLSAAQDGKQATTFEYDSTTYRPADKKFRPYFTAALASLVAAMAQFEEEDEDGYVADVLRPLVEKIEPLVKSMPGEMGYEDRARILYGLGNLYRILGDQGDSIPKLRLAVRMLLRSRSCWRRVSGSSEQMAGTLLTLGRAACTLGDRSEGTTYLKMSLQALDAALVTFTPEKDFVRWARCKISKTTGLVYLGLFLNSPAHLEEAAGEADAVLVRAEIEDFPDLHWQAVDRLAVSYAVLGRLEGNPHRIELAIEGFRQLLKMRTKISNPLIWARTQMNLAISLQDLWKFRQEQKLHVEAWTACERALEVFSPTCHPAFFGETKSVQGGILFRQCQWKEAADFYLKALTTLSPETDKGEYLRASKGLRDAKAQMGSAFVVQIQQNPNETSR